jgi:hypothetical protein
LSYSETDNQPFVERLTGMAAFLFAYSFVKIQSQAPMQSFAWCDTKAHWSPEALAERKINRKIYFDMKYPEWLSIIMPSDYKSQLNDYESGIASSTMFQKN